MKHSFSCPLRWADMDALGHVNNVTYADYLQEARAAMLAGHPELLGEQGGTVGTVVVSHDLTYVAPLVYRSEPVTIQTWVTDIRRASFEVSYEICDVDADGHKTTYVTASTVLAPFDFDADRPRRLTDDERAVLQRYTAEPADSAATPRRNPPAPAAPAAVHAYPCHVRWSDVDGYGHVNNVTFLEYYQEARVAFFNDELSEHRVSVVVAGQRATYRRPMTYRLEPYQVETVVTRIGRSSYTLNNRIVDPLADEVVATAEIALVTIDPETGRPRQHPDQVRDVLERYLAPTN